MAGKGSRNPFLKDTNKIEGQVTTSGLEAAIFSELTSFVNELSLAGGLLVFEKLEGKRNLLVSIAMMDQWKDQAEQQDGRLRRLLCDRENAKDFYCGHLEGPEEAEAYRITLPEGQRGLFLTKSGQSVTITQESIAEMAEKISQILNHKPETQQTEFSNGLELIAKVATRLNDPYQKEDLEIEILAGLCQLFDCQAGSLALWETGQDAFLIKRTYAGGPGWAFQVSIQPEKGLIGECLKTNRPVLANHPESHPLFLKEADSFPSFITKNLLIVPINRVEGVVSGMIALQNKAGGFSEENLSLLMLLANTISRLIINQRTTQELRVANAHLEASRWELVRSRNTLRSLFDNIPDSTYIIDSKYRMIAINLARAKRADCEPRAVIGSLCYKMLYNRDQPCVNCLVGETFFDKRITHRTERVWENVESPQEWDVSVYPILDEGDQVVQVILFEQDLTEKRNMDAILAQSEKMAAVGQLAAGIAHEINNPLTVILANAQLLARDLTNNADALEAVDLISKAGTRALQVVRNLLNFARKEQFDLKATDINATISHALEMLRHEILERDAEIIFETAEHLPLIKASQDNLQGVWLNMLLNAMDSTGEKKSKIHIVTSQSGSEIRVVISDNGLGIPPENLKRIFDPFFTTKGAGRGTGLGLSICHRIIKQHGGHILVDSIKDQGTTFTIVLPIY